MLRKLKRGRAGVGGRRVDKTGHFSVGSCGWGGSLGKSRKTARRWHHSHARASARHSARQCAVILSLPQGKGKGKIAQITVQENYFKSHQRWGEECANKSITKRGGAQSLPVQGRIYLDNCIHSGLHSKKTVLKFSEA